MKDWYTIQNAGLIPTPAMLIYTDRVKSNILLMIEIAGSPNRLRPHVKTHKLGEIVQLQLDYGIQNFKCATIAEAEMCALKGVSDVLIAYPLIGIHIKRLIQLMKNYPSVVFSTLFDSPNGLEEFQKATRNETCGIDLWLDLNVGMGRTGINPGHEAIALCQSVTNDPHLNLRGLHAYDGHNHSPSRQGRLECGRSVENEVLEFISKLALQNINVEDVVVGGTPAFPIHAQETKWTLSPGTCVLSDAKYHNAYPDMPFLPAALILTQVISKPAKNQICLDLGHKAIASEMPHPRIQFFQIPESKAIIHSEEHLVIESEDAIKLEVGDHLYGIPTHICPTMALYDTVHIIQSHTVQDQWISGARNRKVFV